MKKYQQTKLDKRNTFLIIMQIQNKIKVKTPQVERKNILITYENEKISSHGQNEIQNLKKNS